MAIILDQQQTDHSTLELSIGDSPNERAGQSFTTGASGTNIAQIDFWMFKVGLPSGNLTIDIFAASGDSPTGSSLGTSDAVASSGLTTNGNGASVTFNFTTPITGLSGGTKYIAVCSLPSGTDGSNYTRIMGSAASSYANGKAGHSISPLFTWVEDTWDMYFKTYYNDALGSPSSSISPSPSASQSPSSSASLSISLSPSMSPSASQSPSSSVSASPSPSAANTGWQNKPLKYWNGSSWILVDTSG